MAEAGDFNLIVASVESSAVAETSKKFASAFGLDETIAQQICKSAPIIFAQKLTKTEVKAISPTLTELSKAGIEFRVTARVAGKLPKVNWPVRPQFTAGGTAASSGQAFEWDNNAFICPGCGETFLFRRLGKLQLAEPTAVAAAPSNGSEVAARRAASGVRQAVPVPQFEGVEGIRPVAGEGESLDLPDVTPMEVLAPEPVLMAEPEPLSEPAAEPEPVPLDDLPNAEPLPEAVGDFSAGIEPEALPEAAPIEEEAVAETAVEEAPPTGELYNVFLSKITDTSKRDKAAELIAKIKGCSGNEAKELTTRLVIPLAKNVAKEKAEDIHTQFKKLKIFGRMTKVK
jgi:ribosomal protein L7/L12